MSVEDTSPPPGATRAASPWPWIVALSLVIAAFLFWLIYVKGTPADGPQWVATLPAWNALCNTLCAICLVAGYTSIRRGQRRRHMRFMLSAVGFSFLFFAGYVTYHNFHGDTPFPGQGFVRPLYFSVLVSHILLSVVMLPMILATLFYAWRRNFASHRRIARFTFPTWLYVSVTGVAVFFFLRAYT